MENTSFIIVSDSRSALMAIETFNSVHPIVMEIQQWLYMIFRRHKIIEFCWVPSHVGVSSNELADSEAKLAITDNAISDKCLPYSDYYSVIDRVLKLNWQEEWLNVTDNKLRKVKSTVSQWTTSFHRNRHWEVNLARLRLGHTRLTHGHLMENKPPPQCTNCRTRLTVEHVLVECSLYSDERNVWFSHLRRNNERLTIKSILEECDKFSINRLMNFISETELAKEI